MVALTVPVGEAKPGETAPRRRAAQKDAAVERPLDSKATTLVDFFEECAKRNGQRKAMGWRDLVEIHSEKKEVTKIVGGKETKVQKEWLFYENSPYKYITYPDLVKLVYAYGRGLASIGLKGNVDKLHIFAATSHRWLQTFLAAQTQSIAIVTAYDTLGEAGLTHSLVQTDSNGIFADNNLFAALIKPLQKAKSIRYIIHADELTPNDKRFGGKLYADAQAAKEKILEVRPDIKFYSVAEILALGEKNSDLPLQKPKPTDISCIMYTSGSTGDPKGVVLLHENILAACGGVSTVAGRDLVKPTDKIIAFLPLAHIFELVFELISIWWGGCLGYANVKTLTDALCKNCKSDLAEFKPTIMVGVAAVWESVRKGVLAKVSKVPSWKQKLFWASFRAKQTLANYKLPGGGVFDIVFKEIKSATGGELKVVLNGGSPISKDAQVFISTLIAPMLLGYGLTETCANTAILDHNKFQYESVGTLTGAITAKLIDVDEAGYFAKNNQGEVLLKGKCITNEYYKNEKETADAFTHDGWFKTGDIGEWGADGSLRIIDRRKNLVKTLNGEYIALEKLESIYRSNPIVLNLCVYADQNKVKPIAMVIPNEAHLKSFLAKEGIYLESQLNEKELAQLCHDEKVVAASLKFLLSTGKSQGLKGIELLQNVALLDDEWTPQNGYVTSAQKLQRKKILVTNQDKVDHAYASS